MRIIISNPQSRVKDCLECAPKIDLTLRVNGEEKPIILDSLGNAIAAGFDAPTVAPTQSVLATVAATWTDNMYWNYVYVYVAKNKYPLVENAVTGGGSPAPRSNPSPSVQSNSVGDSAVFARTIQLPTSQRSDISHIWIYRTEFFPLSQQALDNATAGNAFWIGEVINNPNLATVPFVDAAIVSNPEQVETDNFVAPQARYCVFADPFFWLIGNDPLRIEVNVSAIGFATIANPGGRDRWFNGRTGQVAKFDGITGGGFDGNGSYYVKILSDSTLQLYLDAALTSLGGVNPSGTTFINIRGNATTLYRSKPRNPFSWGFTDLIENQQIPQLYAFSLGGGRTTSMCVIPNANLLKIDTEGPNNTYTLNLKNAGTPNFEPSLRLISTSYVSSVHFAQFSATVAQGKNEVWGLDSKSFAIIDCDGSSQVSVSDPIYKSLRALSNGDGDRDFFHGGYVPRLEINCMFVRSQGVEFSINRGFYYHWPTQQWGSLDAFDILCSASMLDPFTKEQKLIVGNTEGMVGEFGAQDFYWNWTGIGFNTNVNAQYSTTGNLVVEPFLVGPELLTDLGVVGNWMMIWETEPDTRVIVGVRFAKIAKVDNYPTDEGNKYLIQYGPTYDRDFKLLNPDIEIPYGNYLTYISIGPIELLCQKTFNGEIPFETKKIQEVLSTLFYPIAIDGYAAAPSIGFIMNYNQNWQRFTDPSNNVVNAIQEYEMDRLDLINPKEALNSDASGPSIPTIFTRAIDIPIDQSPVFGIIISDKNPTPTVLYNYEIRMTLPNSNGNNN